MSRGGKGTGRWLALLLCLFVPAVSPEAKPPKRPKARPAAAAPAAKPEPPPAAVEISRDQLTPDGVWFARALGIPQPVRLPASTGYRPGNLFSVNGKWVKVRHLTSNTRTPAFKLGRRKRYFDDFPLYPQEEELLEYADLALFPKPGALPPREAVDVWVEDLDTFLRLHENDRFVVRAVEAFVFNYANNPPKGYLPGDQVWDNRRKFATWIQFFETPTHYDANGVAMLIDGAPLESIPVRISKDKVATMPRLYPDVIRNLEYTFEALRTLMVEGAVPEGDAGLAEASSVRRSYLTLKLMKTGHELWKRMQK